MLTIDLSAIRSNSKSDDLKNKAADAWDKCKPFAKGAAVVAGGATIFGVAYGAMVAVAQATYDVLS